MTRGFFLHALLRESRGAARRFTYFATCLAVGVAGVVAVAGLARALDHGVRREARALLAADVAVRSTAPLPPEVAASLATHQELDRTRIREMVTMVRRGGEGASAPGPSQLVELKAVGAGYPFYGTLRFDPPIAPAALGADSVVVAPGLLTRLGLALGDAIDIGEARFRIVATVETEPDRIASSLSLGPRVFLSLEGLARSGLERFGSRVQHTTLLKLPPEAPPAAVEALAAELREASGSTFYRVETYREAQPALRRGLDRLERFLGLVALLSLAIGGLGVAQTVRAWIAARMHTIAVLRCLGVRPREVLLLYLAQTLLLGLAGSLVGAALGTAITWLAPRALTGLVPAVALRAWQPWAILQGLALGTGTAVLFALSPLLATRRIPPVRVLRRDAEPLPHSRWSGAATGLAVGLGLWAIAGVQAHSVVLGAKFTLVMAVAAAVLALAAWLVSRLVSRLRRLPGGVAVRYGIAALARPGAATLGAIVALGLGVLVVVAMAVVERTLGEALDRELPTDAPSVFLIDIQPDQWQGVEAALRAGGATAIRSVPVITARLRAIDGRSVETLLAAEAAGPDRRWALTREQRLTYLERLPADNRILAGALWSDPMAAEVSVELEFAEESGIALGSRLLFDVQGVPVELRVTSLRSVDWESFRMNFYLVVEPGVLDEAPQRRLASARIPRAGEQTLQDALAAAFPNVTLLRIREVLETIAAVLGRLGLGVRFLGAFTVVAGILILAGAVSAGSLRRGREVALLKALGTTRGGVVVAFLTEYLLIGLVAGLLGTAGGSLLAWGVLTRAMDLDWELRLPLLAAGVAATALLSVAAGLGASVDALRRRPLEVLRRL